MLDRPLTPTKRKTAGLVLLLAAGACGYSSAGKEPARGKENPVAPAAAEGEPLLYGLDFDGHDDYVEIDAFRDDGTYPITIEALVRPHSDQKGTVILLNLEEGTGATVKDESGNGYDGTIHGANWVRLVP